MLRKIIAIITVVLVMFGLFPAAVRAAEDTGTFRIKDYTCELDPWPGGDIMLTISQTWAVTGGHIPWVEVGLPNQYFEIVSHEGAARTIQSANGGGWYGVHIELDKDYQPGSTFSFSFRVRQHYLMQNGSINFTPGWYDTAAIDHLAVTVLVPTDAGELKYYPTPSSQDSSAITWEKSNLKPGEKMTVQVTFSGLVSSTYVPPNEPSDGGSGGTLFDDLFFPILVAVIGGIIALISYRQQKQRQAAALEAEKRKVLTLDKDGKVVKEEEEEYEKPSVRPVTTYRSSCYVRACACVSCACVSCACACACAGGHGAGCAKKGFIDCDKCPKRDDSKERQKTNAA